MLYPTIINLPYNPVTMQSRFFIFLLFFLSAYTATAQQMPRGTFSFSTGFVLQKFTFKGGNQVDYFFSSCTGGKKGSGTYLLRDSVLTLIFEDPDNKELIPLKPVISVQPGSGDTTFFHFKFFDQETRTPVGNMITIYSSRATGHNYGSMSNDSGLLKLRVPGADLPGKIEISSIGVDTRIIPVDAPGTYSVAFPIDFAFIQILGKGDKLEFIVAGQTWKKFFLKEPVNESYFQVYLKN
jgi:hypothetical protein